MRTFAPMKSRQKATPHQTAATPLDVHEALRGPSEQLDPATRACMEPRFGHDFSRIRIHADGLAAESAQRLHAAAYTIGNDIVFGPGKFAPSTSAGKKLIAHELTHVFQAGESTIRRQHDGEHDSDEGASIFPRLTDRGEGSVNNLTTKTFAALGSVGKDGKKYTFALSPGQWGRSNPAIGPAGQKLRDIDFVWPAPATPINGQTDGIFKIGSNDATISPDPKDKKNSKIDDFTHYTKEENIEYR